MADDEHLAYGHYQEEDPGEGNERGVVGDTIKKLKGNAGISSLFNRLHGAIHDIGSEVTGRVSALASEVPPVVGASQNRFQSFAAPREGNDVKWYVDGCGYMWAVSVALERARESIWILDCGFLSSTLGHREADFWLRVAVPRAIPSSTPSCE